MNAFKGLVLGLAVGFVAALTPSCSSSSKCSASTCSAGCCDSSGNCVTTANQNATKCGLNGATCAGCSGSQTCNAGVCGTCTTNCTVDGGCGPSTCPNGCCAQGQCFNQTTAFFCGSGGNACISCPSGDVCNAGACVVDAGTPDAGQNAGVGLPCLTNADCTRFLGSTGTCLLATPSGTPYPSGYCTQVCGTGAPACPGTSECFTFATQSVYGETRTFCLASCASDFDCRLPSYACLGGNNWDPTAQNYIPPNASLNLYFGCFPNVASPAINTGGACTSYTQCSFPPTNGNCQLPILSDGGLTPFTGGYCTSSCLGAWYSSTNPDAYCGDAGICLGDQADTAGHTVTADCYESCPNPLKGTSTCRAGYSCYALTQSDGGPAPIGYCWPSCSAPGVSCTGVCSDGGGFCGDGGYCGC